MTRWEPVAYADIKVGDTIKSVSPCGTVRRGVVASKVFNAYDADANILTASSWTLYRRVPKPAKFTPLDVPEVGQWGEFELRDGTVVTGKVESTSEHYGHDRVWLEGGVDYCLNVKREGRNSSNIIAWSPAEPPAPAEPTTFGYVGYVTRPGGDVWHITRRGGIWIPRYVLVRERDGDAWQRATWADVLSVGTFTAVER